MNNVSLFFGALYIIVEKGMFGYYIGIADNDGPMGRIEDFNYDTYEDAAYYAEEIAICEGLKFLG